MAIYSEEVDIIIDVNGGELRRGEIGGLDGGGGNVIKVYSDKGTYKAEIRES